MSFEAQIDQHAAQAAEAAAARTTSSGDFPPVPGGAYQVVITSNEGVDDFAKDSSNRNYGKKVVRLRVDILPDSPTAAKRVYFGRVPLFTRFAPNPEAKEQESRTLGASAWQFWSFFEKVMGVSRDDIIAGRPLPSNVEGKRATIILSKPKAPDANNPLGFNEIEDWDAPHADFEKTPKRVPGLAVAPWLTPDDEPKTDHPAYLKLNGNAPVGAGAPGIGAPSLPGMPGIGGPALPGGGYVTGGAFPGQVLPAPGAPQVPGVAPVTPIGGYPAQAAQRPPAQPWVQPGAPAMQPAVMQQPQSSLQQLAAAGGSF